MLSDVQNKLKRKEQNSSQQTKHCHVQNHPGEA